jgi:hypothetical protein
VTALVRYQLADLVSSQRWVAPALGYLAFLGFMYASDAGPAVPAFGVTALALLPVAAWLTRQTLGTEDDAARQVTSAAAGGTVRVQTALLVSSLLALVPFAVVAIAWAYVADHTYVRTAAQLVGGLAVQLVFAVAGLGLGAVVARPLVRPPGAAALLIVAVFVLSLVVPWSPVLRASHVLQTDPVHHFGSGLYPWMVALFACGAAGLAASLAAAVRE